MSLKIEDFGIGDEVRFISQEKPPKNDYDESWVVTGKYEQFLQIDISKAGYNDAHSITVDEVIGHTPLAKITSKSDSINVCIDRHPDAYDKDYSPKVLFEYYKENPASVRIDESNSLDSRIKQRLESAVREANVTPLLSRNKEYNNRLHELALHSKYIWDNGMTLRVRFLDGTSAQHKLVQDAAPEWADHAHLFFDFVASGEAEIRISFNPDLGHWSRVGRDCLTETDQAKATMNLAFTGQTTIQEANRTILHEFGHAIGCVHEHQRPDAGISWNIPVINTYYARTQNWSPEKIAHNVIGLYDAREITNSGYDVDSIMHYAIERAHVTDPTHARAWNNSLSPGDIDFIKEMYPRPRGLKSSKPLFDKGFDDYLHS